VKIATWNVNSITARLPGVLAWVKANAPDVLLLQELKTIEENFPAAEFEALGYTCAVYGQKAWNGVAILSKPPISDITKGLPGDAADEQARYIEGTVKGIRIACLYLPNGNPVESEKYPYKLAWMSRLRVRAAALLAQGVPFVLGGDFNIIPEGIDCHDPKAWEDDALFRLESRRAFRAIVNLGLTDAFRALHPDAQEYTFWDYQAGCRQRNAGLRIDHFLLSPQATDRLESCVIDSNPRDLERASDHVPVMVTLA